MTPLSREHTRKPDPERVLVHGSVYVINKDEPEIIIEEIRRIIYSLRE